MAPPGECYSGDYVLKRENAGTWVATAPCGDGPHTSPVGYGGTQKDAFDDLVRQPQFQEYLKRTGRKLPTLDCFKIDDRPVEEIIPE